MHTINSAQIYPRQPVGDRPEGATLTWVAWARSAARSAANTSETSTVAVTDCVQVITVTGVPRRR
ncbi:hypothetical protein KO481_17365 [Nocardia sp. NEAU-G5]|uniref:Uncharacterized protein n=1 Tax=Nocardia albiluteola TaxID=2842303 RepID=A0ABS6AZ01_9NOCA|nr:hypothetical protein [Nocardia albiluteola]MBU3063290.1 hypothetical protein [Nocardia albiluteola]